jgi:hypothetical protein
MKSRIGLFATLPTIATACGAAPDDDLTPQESESPDALDDVGTPSWCAPAC